MSFNMEIDKNNNERHIVSLSGDLDIESSDKLKGNLLKIFNEEKKDIVIDLEKLNYLDSMGIGVLISVYNEVDKEGYKISIVNAQENIYKLFKITDLLDVFNMR